MPLLGSFTFQMCTAIAKVAGVGSGSGTLEFTLVNPNAYGTSFGDSFGNSVAMSGNYAIVGAYTEDDAAGDDSGKAYIFNATTGALVHTLNNPNPYGTGTGDRFGYSVAISGDRAIVGAHDEDDAGGNGSGKAYIYNVTTGALVHTLNNPTAYGTGAGDNFGYSVAISGDRAIVGAYRESDAGGTYSGKAYIYNVTTGALVYTLDDPNAYGTSASDNFGWAVAISDTRAIVGAPGEMDANALSSSGKAYIYNVTTGALLYTLNNPNAYSTSTQDFFGNSVAISGDRAIVGAYLEDDAGGTSSGKAYIYNVTTGALVHTLNNPNAYNTSNNDYFGRSVAISGNYAVVGAYLEDDAGGTSSGKAYIFNITTGALVYTLDDPNAYGGSFEDFFGNSVAVSGDYAIVGASSEDDAGGTGSGKAYIYNATTGALVHTLTNPNAYGTSVADSFGYSVAISGDRAIVSAHQESDAGGTDSGKAYIFNVTTGALVYTLDNPNAYDTSNNDRFGNSVAISGDRAIVGAYGEDDAGGTGSGKAYIFNVTTGALVHTITNPNAYGTSASDNFGWSVAISGDRAIVGAYNEDDAGGNSSGKAYIFNVTTGALVHTLTNPNTYNTSFGDSFGWSVAISGDRAIVGARYEDAANGNDSGRANIYNVTTGALVHTLTNPNPYSTGTNDYFGNSVGISGNYAVVGAYQEDDASGTNSGKAYIYNVTTGALLYTLTNPNAYGTGYDDSFGYSVAISDDRAIVGVYTEDDAGGNSSGKAYIFNATNGAQVHTLTNPNPYSASTNDYFGSSVTISGDRAIVGAYNEGDAGGVVSGKAYVYILS